MARVAGFSEATYIGLHAMVLIAQKDGERISIRAMAETICVSEAHLAKVILRLAHTGLISTTRGPGGGAVLAKKPKEISFLDIVEAIEGPLENTSCVFGKSHCTCKECIFGDFLIKMTKEAKEWLGSKTLAEF
ncbi:MAG: Rrf2 family transcriptional regulator [Synergistaceae bacterium]|nr:Rrf2 family transcriptional regulator [Synergistaceae bacterium]